MRKPFKVQQAAVYRCSLLAALIAAVVVFSAMGLRAQNQSEKPPTAKNAIHVHVNEVVLPVTVTDQKGELVLDLRSKDFHVLDAGVEQKIRTMSLDPEPLSLVLVIETSSHIQSLMPLIHKNAIVFAEQVVAMEDGFKLYDALAKSEALLATEQANRRRVILVIGESQDSGSAAKLSDVVRTAQHENISLYSIGLSSSAAEFKSGDVAPLKLGKDAPSISTTPPPADARGDQFFDIATPALWLVGRATNEIS